MIVNLYSNLWCGSEESFHRLIDMLEAAEALEANDHPGAGEGKPFSTAKTEDISVIAGDTATIPIEGPLMRKVPAFAKRYGVPVTAADDVAYSVKQAAANPEVKHIVLQIDSPGGSISGIPEAAEAIRAAGAVKPVSSSIGGGMAVSAAYWLGSQAQHIEAGPSAMVGSIGTILTLVDSSKAAEEMGIKVIPIASSKLKATGTPGKPVTKEDVADMQRLVDTATARFIADIATGRNITTAAASDLATGQVWFAPEAKGLGLVDTVTGQATDSAPAATTEAKGNTMDKEEVLALFQALESSLSKRFEAIDAGLTEVKEQNKAVEAKAAATQANIEAAQKAVLLENARQEGRVFAGNAEAVEMFAEKASLEELRKFVATLQPQHKEGIAHHVPAQPQNKEQFGAADLNSFRVLGVQADAISKTDAIAGMTCDGKLIMEDGSQKKATAFLETEKLLANTGLDDLLAGMGHQLGTEVK